MAFITLEGIEGVGKSTCIATLKAILEGQGKTVITTREPGGTAIAESIREILLASHSETMHQDTELLLMFASRAQHLHSVILPALQNGSWVICDRFSDASFAYQGSGRGIAREKIQTLADWTHPHFSPDLTFILDAPPEVGLARVKSRGRCDRIESETLAFFVRVRQAYLDMANANTERYIVIDATASEQTVKQVISQRFEQWIQQR